ncbi:hypothetical protein M9458_029705, partial [Cirrhinus mrigala]
MQMSSAFNNAALNCSGSGQITTTWREAIIQCLESVYPQSRAQPDPDPSSPSSHYTELKPEATDNVRSDKVEDRRGDNAGSDVRPGARAGYNAHHEGKP